MPSLLLVIGILLGVVIAGLLVVLALTCGVVKKVRNELLAEQAECARLRIIQAAENAAHNKILAAARTPFTINLTEQGALKLGDKIIGAIETLWVSKNERPN